MRSITHLSLLCALALIPAAGARGAFTAGDCIYVTAASGYGPGTQAAVILIKFNPLVLTQLALGNGITGDGAYDSYRESAIVIRATDTGRVISAINAAGTMTNIPYSGSKDVTALAPTGDGRIYFQRPGSWSYVDAFGTTHALFNVSNTGPFAPSRSYRRAYYDKSTNSIFTGDAAGINAAVTRIPLSADGSHLAAAPTEIALSTPTLSTPITVGISAGPGGKLFIKLDDNGGGLGPRMILLDPATLVQSTYAQSNYFGVGGEISGCYAPNINEAVVVDSLADQLRTFAFGSSGAGVIVGGTSVVSSGGGSGENATMFPISASTAVCAGDFNHDGVVDDADFSIFVVGYNILDCADPAMPAGCPADINHDGLVDDADFSLFVVAYDALLCP